MIVQPIRNTNTALGPLERSREGDVGRVAAPAVACLEEHSLNYSETPGALSNSAGHRQHKRLQDRGPSGESTLGNPEHSGPKTTPLNSERPSNKHTPSSNNNTPNNSPPNTPSNNSLPNNNPPDDNLPNNNSQNTNRTPPKPKQRGHNIASLNIKGQYQNNKESKYTALSTITRKNKILCLALQETKLKPSDEPLIENIAPKVTLINNPLDDDSRSAGTAFILNNDLMKNKSYQHEILIEGRAARLKLTLNDEQSIDIINIYCPNSTQEKITFLNKLHNIIEKIDDWNQPILVGDFNFVEDAIDRLPAHPDEPQILDAFNKIKNKLKLVDGWRENNLFERQYTFEKQNPDALARIDRIYINANQTNNYTNWDFIEHHNLSDHTIITTELLPAHLPFVGPGLWRLNKNAEEYIPFRKRTKEILKKAKETLDTWKNQDENTKTTKRNETNPQKIWTQTKLEIKQISQEETKNRRNQINKRKNNLKQAIKRKLLHIKNQNLNPDEEKRMTTEIINIQKKLNTEAHDNLKAAQLSKRARFASEGETNSKYWYALNKETPTPNIITELKDENGTTYNKTNKMTKIAQTYHQKLQTAMPLTPERETAIKEMTDLITDKLDEEQKDLIDTQLTENDVLKALKNSDNGKAPGPDGLSYEFYKTWSNDEEIEIHHILQTVFNDIETHGLDDPTFAQGSMTLLYKKKEKNKIENYRPITLLNTDYKIMTKALATKLGKVAPHIIHPNQAGFVPNRSLYDHTTLTQLIISYCEQTGTNGCLVALDQEKAYDKIAHDYLWRVLEKMNFPTSFINTVKSLYQNVETKINLNGVTSDPIKVNRGVRQGDPISCLLYDLAIEPLAIAIRKSALQGISIPNAPHPIKVTLFADDTLVYLKDTDDITILDQILDTFCLASTAKFNKEKTEILPTGTKPFRDLVIRERKIGNYHINPEKTIIKEGQPMRTLGAWVGNNIEITEQWDKIIEKQKQIIHLWERSRPSMRGKELLLKSLIQSRALFLATVNGMPQNTEKQMTRLMKDFLWNNKKGLLDVKYTISPRDEGGLNTPHLRSRLEAIEIIWLRKYLAPHNKPDWTYVADAILKNNITAKPIVEIPSRISWALQTWHESAKPSAKIPKLLKNTIKTARKFNIGFDATKPGPETLELLPIWNHIAAQNNYLWNKKSAKCLRNNHNVKTVKNLLFLTTSDTCDSLHKCTNMALNLLDKLPPKFDPTNNTMPHPLDHTPTRKERNNKASLEKDEITFDPNMTSKEHPLDLIRILKTNQTYKKRRNKDLRLCLPTPQKERKNNTPDLTINIIANKTHGTIYIENNHPLNKNIKTHKSEKSENEIITMIYILNLPNLGDITIQTPSLELIKNITRNTQRMEDLDWLDIQNQDLWKTLMYNLRRRGNKTTLKFIDKDNAGQKNLYKALKKTLKASQNPIDYNPDTQVPPEFLQDGVRLQALTQKSAYKLIICKHKKDPSTRHSTSQNLNKIKYFYQNNHNQTITNKEIWQSQKKPWIPHNIQDFIWKITHNALKCGTFFQHIPTLSEKANCTCGEIETPEHILLHCRKNHTPQLWENIISILREMDDTVQWATPSIENIMTPNLTKLPHKKGDQQIKEKYRLYQTIITETIWIIWKERNNRIFNETETLLETLENKWKYTIEKRITTEWAQITLLPFKQRKLQENKFTQRWCINDRLASISEDKALTTNLT